MGDIDAKFCNESNKERTMTSKKSPPAWILLSLTTEWSMNNDTMGQRANKENPTNWKEYRKNRRSEKCEFVEFDID